MLSSFKGKAVEQDGNTAANADELMGRTVQPPSHTVVEQVAPRPEPTLGDVLTNKQLDAPKATNTKRRKWGVQISG